MSDSKDDRPRVALVFQNHMVTGELRLGDGRFSDLLNDVHHSFIELDNAACSHVAAPEKVIDQTPRTVLPKDQVIVAFELSGNSVGPKRIYQYRKKRQYAVFLATRDVEIRAFLHATPTEALPDLWMIQDRRFVPLTRATVTFCAIENCELTQDAILVNVREIQYFSVGEAVPADN